MNAGNGPNPLVMNELYIVKHVPLFSQSLFIDAPESCVRKTRSRRQQSIIDALLFIVSCEDSIYCYNCLINKLIRRQFLSCNLPVLLCSRYRYTCQIISSTSPIAPPKPLKLYCPPTRNYFPCSIVQTTSRSGTYLRSNFFFSF